MSRNTFAVIGAAALLGLTLACTSNSSTPLSPEAPAGGGNSGTASDGSTLKVTAPVPQSPINNVKPATGPAKLIVSASSAPYVPVIAVNYRYQIFNAANVMVENAVVNSTNYEVKTELTNNLRYTWRARAEGVDVFGPWSTTASFTAPETAFLGVSTFADPLTNGKTVGQQHGGTFIPGQGWQSLSTNDGIDYDLQQACSDNCTLEFDVTNFGPQEGQCCAKDLKWLSMGDASAFSSFGVFRDHPWKMHLVQRADYPTGMEIIWRNGDAGDGDDPGDHRIKLVETGVVFSSSTVYHFKLEWATTGYVISVNGQEVMSDGWDYAYAPPNHRISLGCYPRSESMVGAIYRNIKLKQG